jgi:hypothetical protein
MCDLLVDVGTLRPCEYLAETSALDSGENLILSGCQVRRHNRLETLGLLWIWGAFEMKRARFELGFRALGIAEQAVYRWHSNSPAAGAAAIAGEERLTRDIEKSGDYLLLGPRFEEKRRRRYAGTLPFANRLDPLRDAFPAVFGALDELRACIQRQGRIEMKDYSPLQQAYRSEVLKPKARERETSVLAATLAE